MQLARKYEQAAFGIVFRAARVAKPSGRSKIKVTTAAQPGTPPRRDAKMTPPRSVAPRYYRELINLLKYLLYLFIIRTPRCGPELSRASKQLPLNSSCNGHAECAGVQSDFISLRGSDRAYITRAFLRRLSRAAPSLFPGYGLRAPWPSPSARFRSISSALRRGFNVFCGRAHAGAH